MTQHAILSGTPVGRCRRRFEHLLKVATGFEVPFTAAMAMVSRDGHGLLDHRM
jgi:hypothetical protein